MSNQRIAQLIKNSVNDTDLEIRQQFLGRSYLDKLEGEIHPDGPVAHDLRYSVNLLRDLANAIEAKLTTPTRRAA